MLLPACATTGGGSKRTIAIVGGGIAGLTAAWRLVNQGHTVHLYEGSQRTGGRMFTKRQFNADGQFVELVPNEKIVTTEQFDDPWHEGDVVGTVTFAEQDGVTTVSMRLRYDSQRVRDEIVASNMARGIVSSYAALDEVLLEL